MSRPNHLSLLLFLMAILVFALSLWSLIVQPTATLLVTLPHAESLEHQLEAEEQDTAWWQMRLLLDNSDIAAGVVASAENEARAGIACTGIPKPCAGASCAWEPGPKLLGQGVLEQAPRRLSVHRYGYRLVSAPTTRNSYRASI